MKYTISLIFVFVAGIVSAQCLTIKAEVKTEGVKVMGIELVPDIHLTMQYKFLKSKMTTAINSSITTQYTNGDSIVLLQPDRRECIKFTSAELKADSLEDRPVLTELKIEKTKETKRILGYNCTKAIARYVAANSGDITGAQYHCETEMWITNELDKNAGLDSMVSFGMHDYIPAELKNLGGTALLTVTTTKETGMKTSLMITEINTKELADAVFEVAAKLCKKPITYKEYKKRLKEEQMRRNEQMMRQLQHGF